MIYRRVLWVSLEGPSMTVEEANYLRDNAERLILTRASTRGAEGVLSLRFNGLSSFDRLKPDNTIVGIYEMSVLMDVEATSEDHADSIMRLYFDVELGKIYFNKYTTTEVSTIERGIAVE